MPYEMEIEDYLVAAKRKLAVVEQQNQDLREQNGRLTLALDEAREDDSVQLTHKGWSQITDSMAKSIVRLDCEADELRAEVAMLREERNILASERDAARMQYRTTELLGMALVKTIDELKAEKAAIFAKLVSLQAGSRRATLEEIAESVREKYEPEHEREGMDNE
jgi:cell division protein FtsB